MQIVMVFGFVSLKCRFCHLWVSKNDLVTGVGCCGGTVVVAEEREEIEEEEEDKGRKKKKRKKRRY